MIKKSVREPVQRSKEGSDLQFAEVNSAAEEVMQRSNTPVPLAIKAQNVTKRFGTKTAVNDVSLHFAQGEVTALLGPNGAGKTTFVDMILGLQQSNAGNIEVFGMGPREAIRRSLVGVMNQTGALPVDYTVIAALTLFGSFHLHPLPTEKLLNMTALGDLKRQKIRRLSGGEQQRLRLALALQGNPLLLLLDEPTSGMDAAARSHFWELMHQQADLGRTIIFATHYLAEAEDFADRTVIMNAGKIIADGVTQSLLTGPKTLTVQINAAKREQIIDELRSCGGKIYGQQAHLTLVGGHTDDAARIILSHPDSHELQIATPTLEDTFKKMVEDQA